MSKVSSIRSSIGYLRQTAAAIALAQFTIGCAATQTKIPMGEVPVAQAPTLEDITTTKSYVEQAMGEEGYNIKPQKGASYERVKRVVERLSRAAGVSSASFPVYLVEAGDDVNAMAVQNTTIVVYEELLRRVPDDNELAVVIGHEIAHIAARHADDDTSETRSSAVGVGSYILGTVAGVAAAYAGAGSAVADIAGNVTANAINTIGVGALVRSYDRKLEYEADHVGLMIMAKAGYNPQAALSFWKRSDEIFGTGGNASFLSTHPSHDDRLDNLAEALPIALQYYTQARAQFAAEDLEASKKTSRKKVKATPKKAAAK